ncbi:phosphotransferase enzyme family protein [methane-oxidizing endosymbiont of Gigantopelta aegis]|uniref:phosphotransferase enzyme family protein n=1 Tax=methane-oxidizing endosymbiont of Gigantopelta aegis TaxID=2794938 RepID=UPI0018DB0AC5|nr:aminoglycoside phosphotransferase family protein [methane-oxidizing endosymbiont of Gigantopelta aegis]
MKTAANAVIAAFFPDRPAPGITPLGHGLINTTFRLDWPDSSWVLQRINTQVFPQPEKIMHNLLCLQNHLQKSPEPAALVFPTFRTTPQGALLHYDTENQPWRVMSYIKNSETRDSIRSTAEAANVGNALAQFHRQFANLPVNALHDTLPGFHITPQYLAHYEQVMQEHSPPSRTGDDLFCQQFIARHRSLALMLEQARSQAVLQPRITHGDPKLNNFLFRTNSNQVCALIDLDTVKPGLLLHDIADCVRSVCQTPDQHLDLVLLKALLGNYLQSIQDVLTPADMDYMYPAIALLPFELGLRFFTDYLQGNVYFSVDYPQQNLQRSLYQFRLCQDILEKREAIERLIAQLLAAK